MKRKLYLCYCVELETNFKKFIKTFDSVAKAAEAIGCSAAYLYQIVTSKYPLSVEMALKIKNCSNGQYDFLDYFMGSHAYGAAIRTLDELMRHHYFKRIAESLEIDVDSFFKFYVPLGIQQILNKSIENITDEDLHILKCLYGIPTAKLQYEIDSIKL